MSTTQARSRTIVIVAAVAKNGVIGNRGSIPWHLPEDFAHFKEATVHQTLLMGRTTFDSIGRPLPNRSTIVLTRDRDWSRPGIHVRHNLQDGIDAAEDLPGSLMVAGGSHIYAEMLPLAREQILSVIDDTPPGDTLYPTWDKDEWIEGPPEARKGFTITRWIRKSERLRAFEFALPTGAAQEWWSQDWDYRLRRSVHNQRRNSPQPDKVNWAGVHAAAMRVIIEAAEDQQRRGEQVEARTQTGLTRRIVRISSHLSVDDLHEAQGALFHWSGFLAPRKRV